MSHDEVNILPTAAVRSSTGESGAAILPAVPVPRCPISVRLATAKDLPFIDQLQKMHGHMVGWLPGKQLQDHLEAGHVLVAEAHDLKRENVKRDGGNENANRAEGESSSRFTSSRFTEPLGYCIAQDHYMGRDDVGIVFQLNVAPLKQRHLIGATLIKATFERAAYGCRLFSCWCAQDIQANWFWEAIGFVPLAFRTGSRSMQRIHIFWQRRVRENDTTTPYWFPAQTKSGSVREDRLVLPIPPGTHWRDVKTVVLPALSAAEGPGNQHGRDARVTKKPFVKKVAVISSPPPSKHLKQVPRGKAAVVTGSGIRYLDRADYVPESAPPKPKRARPPAAKHDPKMIAAARELRDRYLEQINATSMLPQGKYDVSRALPGAGIPIPDAISESIPALPAPVAA